MIADIRSSSIILITEINGQNEREMLLRKVNGDVLPFAGITLTRFYGFDLRPRRYGRGHPGKH